MNKVRELRIKKGIPQKDLAITLGVSQASVSDWEKNKKNPRGENLAKLAEYFGVDEDYILGVNAEEKSYFITEDPKTSGISETEQIVEHVLKKMGMHHQPQTEEARIISGAVDKLTKPQREQALAVMRAMFAAHSDYFRTEDSADET